MIPQPVKDILNRLPAEVVEQRLICEDSRRYVELYQDDADLLLRIGIEVDKLGPEKAIILWDEDSELPIGGYLVVDSLAMGRPSMGGIRRTPQVTPAMISSLARGMTMKNAAAGLPFGGGKSGIVSPQSVTPEEKREMVIRFARLIAHYDADYNPGPDVGITDEDMGLVAMQNGLDTVLSKPARMGGVQIDNWGATAGGVVVALETILNNLDTLAQLPQFAALPDIAKRPITVLIQGFGAVGAQSALMLHESEGAYRFKVIGVSDSNGYLHSESGLDIPRLFEMIGDDKTVANKFYLQTYSGDTATPLGDVSFSTRRDDLIRDSADVFIPAAPVANYIGLDKTTDPSMTLHQIGHWHLIVEGANTYSVIAERKSERRSIERVLYRERGTFIGTDFLVNSGGVIFAAHELLVPTPDDLNLPPDMRGDTDACEKWFADHADAFARLAEERANVAREWRDRVLQDNMTQLIEKLVEDRNRLPCDVAEDIARSRIEKARTVDGLMTGAFVRVKPGDDLHAVASKMKEVPSEVALVETEDGSLMGILTDWDIVEAVADCLENDCCAKDIMTGEVFTLSPKDSIVEVKAAAHKHGYSAMPVTDDTGQVLGIVQLPDLIET